jgi:response regulator RpfG family c-di-GMP phosphodiesterase
MRRDDRAVASGVRVLLIDDEPALRELLRVTLESERVRVDEAADGFEADARIQAHRPNAIVLDLQLPGEDGAQICARLKSDPYTRGIPIVLLTGADPERARQAKQAGAEALLHKPFSPLELVALLERLTDGSQQSPTQPHALPDGPQEELILYGRDLQHLLAVERRQRDLLERSYLATVSALANALEVRDTGTGAHSQRVQRYALALLFVIDPDLAEREPALRYGFLLHDIGKLALPDRILLKPGPLTATERRQMEQHTVIGETMLAGAALLHGEPLRLVRSHHERWDGTGYPDRLVGDQIPLAARVFALADTLDAITSDRPYRPAQTWHSAHAEITQQRGRQFDPRVVDAFTSHQTVLRGIHQQYAAA